MARGMAPSRRIAVVASDARRLILLRAPLLAAITAQGHGCVRTSDRMVRQHDEGRRRALRGSA